MPDPTDDIGNDASSGTNLLSTLKSLGTSATAGAATGGLGWLTAIPSLWKLGAGLFQGLKGNSLSNTQRPTFTPPAYSIPPEVQQYLNKTSNRVIDPNLPGQNRMEEKLGAQTSDAITGAEQAGKSSGDILNTIAKVVGNQNDAENNLGVKAAENYQGLVQKKDSDLSTALLTSAGYKDKKYEADLNRYNSMFKTNQLDPFDQATAAASALKNASGQNLYGGVNDLSAIATLMSFLRKQKGVTAPTTTASTTPGSNGPTGIGYIPPNPLGNN